MTLEARVIALAQAIGADVKTLTTNQGSLTALTTTAKTNLVAAVNELVSLAGTKAVINDDATNGATSVTWSADKIYDAIEAAKAAVTNSLTNGAAAALDTLNELAAALGDDPNFATTMTAALGGKQPLDATLTALAGVSVAADSLLYATAADAFATTPLTATARTLLDDTSVAAMRSTLGAAESGANASITSLTGLTTGITVAQGGTGRSTGTTAYGLIAAGTTATGAQQTLASGATTQILVGGGASALPVWTTATGSGAPVRATSPTLVTPVLGVATGTSFNSITGLSSTSPVMDGTAAVGTGTTTARGDHRHPTDTSRAPIASPSFTGTLTHSGDIVLSGSGKRITGDFSNATVANRVMFQTSTVNGATLVGILPNGTGNVSGTICYGTSDTLNNPYLASYIDPAAAIVEVGKVGTGSYLPLAYKVGGAERLRIDTSGNVLVTSPAGLGYGVGAGGTVTQATSKATAVTLNKPCGQIILHPEAVAIGGVRIFYMYNSLISEYDALVLSFVDRGEGVVGDGWIASARMATGVAAITLQNVAGQTIAGSFALNFIRTKGAVS